MNVTITGRQAGRLGRENRRSGSPESLQILLAEAVARRWFLRKGVPCWRTEQKPCEDARYSLLFRSGRRALVLPHHSKPASLNIMAKAKCDYMVLVKMVSDTSGYIGGFLILSDVHRSGDIDWRPDPGDCYLRKMETFPELLHKPAYFRWCYLLGSIKLLISGDRRIPPPLVR